MSQINCHAMYLRTFFLCDVMISCELLDCTKRGLNNNVTHKSHGWFHFHLKSHLVPMICQEYKLLTCSRCCLVVVQTYIFRLHLRIGQSFIFCTCYRGSTKVLLRTIGPDVLPHWLHQPVSVTLGNGSGEIHSESRQDIMSEDAFAQSWLLLIDQR